MCPGELEFTWGAHGRPWGSSCVSPQLPPLAVWLPSSWGPIARLLQVRGAPCSSTPQNMGGAGAHVRAAWGPHQQRPRHAGTRQQLSFPGLEWARLEKPALSPRWCQRAPSSSAALPSTPPAPASAPPAGHSAGPCPVCAAVRPARGTVSSAGRPCPPTGLPTPPGGRPTSAPGALDTVNENTL